ncbi:signal peptidase I [Nocardioides marmorisolisilvae]|uniref:signal peptidase I n=1 Tax=Nocardioides marmorisolisilvae TaxID=1542737 RepID=UPI00160856DF|nr:signal peptidase I [Nocardioides marmorisolisilvae]
MALSVTAVLGAVALLLTVLALVTGVRPLIFRSGSMSPGIPTGSLGFARGIDAPDIKVGDVVTVKTARGDRVTHRVVDVTYHDDVSTLRLKGDANNAPDDALYRVTHAQRLWFSVPRAGYVVSWLSNAPGSYLLALYVAGMLLLVARRRPEQGGDGPAPVEPESEPAPLLEEVGDETPPRRPGRGPARIVTAGALLALGVAVVSGWGQSTWALWSDQATVGTSTISSGTWGPVITACSRNTSSGEITVTWTGVTGATSYNVNISNPSSTLTNKTSPFTTTTIGKNGAGGTVSITAVTPGGNLTSVAWFYDGSGANQACHA